MLPTPPEISAYVKTRRRPRARATKKLRSVLSKLVDGNPPLDRVRSAWVHGSYARGAPDVEDVDLVLRIDEPRERAKQLLDAFYRRAHPYAEVVAAIGCGGSSFVRVDVHPHYLEGQEPQRVVREAERPELAHAVTGKPFDPQPILLWQRGEGREEAFARLEELKVDPSATRYERTTGVELLDDLHDAHFVPVVVAYPLAAQIKAKTLAVQPVLLEPSGIPHVCWETLRWRYTEQSPRRAAAAAAIQHLLDEGVEIERIVLVDQPADDDIRLIEDCGRPRVWIDFNSWHLHQLASGQFRVGVRHVHIWPRPKNGPWLALDIEVLSEKAEEVYAHFRSAAG